ncbi:hypothetical protein K7432_018006, partial [Basidiobolus ranarum]
KEHEVAELQGQNYGEIVLRHTQPQIVEKIVEKIVVKEIPAKVEPIKKKSFLKKIFA